MYAAHRLFLIDTNIKAKVECLTQIVVVLAQYVRRNIKGREIIQNFFIVPTVLSFVRDLLLLKGNLSA